MNNISPARVIIDRAEPVAAPPGQMIAAAKKPGRRRWLWIAAVVVALGAGYWALSARQATVPPPAAAATRPVQLLASEVTTIAPTLLREQVSISGSLAPIRQATLSFQAGGLIEEIPVKPGERVAAGAVIARLETADFATKVAQQKNAIAATEAQLELARKQLASTRTLADKGLTPRANLDSAQATVNAQAANLAAQQAQLESIEITFSNTTLTAPFDGFVSARNVEPGQTVGAGAAVVTVVDLSEMEFQATAPVSAAASLAPDQVADVTVEGQRNETLEARISRISPVAVAGTRSIPVFLTLENPGERLRGGMFATGKVTIAESADAIAIPSAAVRNDDAGTFVLAARDGKLVRVPVDVVRTWNGTRLSEITGVAVGDVVVSASLPELRAGADVVVAAE